jgi:hypothetical protein
MNVYLLSFLSIASVRPWSGLTQNNGIDWNVFKSQEPKLANQKFIFCRQRMYVREGSVKEGERREVAR